MLVERGELAVGPVLVKDVEPHGVPLDDEVVERGHRVWIITGATHHAAEFVADFLDDEELFRCADAESQPHADHIFLRQLCLPWAGLNVWQAVCPVRIPARRVGRYRRSLRKHGHHGRYRIGSPWILDEDSLEPAAAASAARACYDQAALAEPRD